MIGLDFSWRNSESWLNEELISNQQDVIERIVYEPLGVVANISAWNYPIFGGGKCIHSRAIGRQWDHVQTIRIDNPYWVEDQGFPNTSRSTSRIIPGNS